eukprot:GHVS01105400.1.p1 GENE.GHVS01105400.1~~GHVS01105400.1.p1  ORF type:complete len:535 (+),score=47.56 GHVS01105400.1:175-1605(+)
MRSEFVQSHIQSYAEKFQLVPLIDFCHTVRCVKPRTFSEAAGWLVDGEAFDVVVVATGHFNVPRIPTGMIPDDVAEDNKLQFVIHSCRYDTPDRFAGQSVLVVGGASSGTDIIWELSTVCATLVWSCHDVEDRRDRPLPHNCILINRVRRVRSNGAIEYLCNQGPHRLGSSFYTAQTPKGDCDPKLGSGLIYGAPPALPAMDGVIFATGYHNHLPFLHEWQNACEHSPVKLSEKPFCCVGREAFDTCDPSKSDRTVDTDDNEDREEFRWADQLLSRKLILNLFHEDFVKSLFFIGFITETIPAVIAEAQSKAMCAMLTGNFPIPALFRQQAERLNLEAQPPVAFCGRGDSEREQEGVASLEGASSTYMVAAAATCLSPCCCAARGTCRHRAVTFPLAFSKGEQLAYIELMMCIGKGLADRFIHLSEKAREQNLKLPSDVLTPQIEELNARYAAVAARRKVDPYFRDRDNEAVASCS